MGLLCCPTCHHRLTRGCRECACRNCAYTYPIVKGVPVLLEAASGTRAPDPQVAFFDQQVDTEFEITRPRRTPAFHAWLLQHKLRRSVMGLEQALAGGTAVTVCGGSGMDAEFLAHAGARVISADLSLGAALRAKQRAKRYGLPILAVVADAARLPLSAQAVDVAYVHDGLHHIADPHAGIRELARVARRAVSITEPAAAAITSFSRRVGANRMGFALDVEEAGNPVSRMTLDDVAEELATSGFDGMRAERYAMVYRHEAGGLMRLLSRRRLLPTAVAATIALNAVFGRFGNKLSVRSIRTP